MINKTTTICFEGSEVRTLTIRGKKVVGWQTRSLTLDEMNQGLIHDPQAVSKVIKASLMELKASRRNVISAVPGIRSVHRIIRIPVIPEKMLAETIERKARQEFAIPIEESDLSWRVITQREDHLILYVLAVPNQIINSHVAALKAAGIRPRVMDIKPLALSRLSERETAIIVNLEEHSMDVIINVHHIPMLVRSIPLDSGDLTGEARTDLLSQELARTTKYHNESHKKNRLPQDTPIYLSGALFSSREVDARLDEDQSLIERLSLRTPYPLKPPQTSLELPAKFPLLTYATNLGLAVKK